MPGPDYHLHVCDSDSLAMSDIFILLHLSKLLDPLASLKCSTSPAFCCSEDMSLSGKRKESLSGKREECWNSIETDLIAMPSARHYASSVNKQPGPKKRCDFNATLFSCHIVAASFPHRLQSSGMCRKSWCCVRNALFWPNCSCASSSRLS